MALRPNRTMPIRLDSSKIESVFSAAIEGGRELSGIMERGQADTPLSDRFDEMRQAWIESSLSAVLLGLSSEATARTLAFYTAEDVSSLQAFPFHDSVRLVELFLPSDRLAYRDAEGSWNEFDTYQDFVDALGRMIDELPDERFLRNNPLGVRIKSASGVARLRICIPADLEQVIGTPSLLLRTSSASSLLMVAAPPDAQLSPLHQELLSLTGKGVNAVLPIVIAGEEGQPPDRGWWNDGQMRLPGERLEPLILGGKDRPGVPELLHDPSNALRKALLLRFMGKDLKAVYQALMERHEKEMRQASRKRGVLESRVKELDDLAKRSDSRATADAIKYELDSATSKLADKIANLNQMEFAPTSQAWVKLAQVIDTLEELDVGESTPKAEKLEIPRAFLDRLRHFMEKLCHARLEQDFQLIREDVDKLSKSLSRKVSDFAGKPVTVNLAIPDQEEVWTVVRSLVTIDFRSRGELPKRTFFQFLSTGRQMAFMVLISAQLLLGSLLKAYGLNLRNIAPIVLAIFAIGVYAGIRAFKKDKQEMMRKELDRVKDGVQDEARRLVQETQRDKMARINSYLNNLSKQTLHVTDDLIKVAANEKLAALEREKSDVKARLANLDLRLRQLQSNEKLLANLDKSLVEVETAGQSLLTSESDAMRKSAAEADEPAVEKTETPERPEPPEGLTRPDRPERPAIPSRADRTAATAKRERPTLPKRPPISIKTRIGKRKEDD